MNLYELCLHETSSFGVEEDSASMMNNAFDTGSLSAGNIASCDDMDSDADDNVMTQFTELRERLGHLRERLLRYREMHAYNGLARFCRRLERSIKVVDTALRCKNSKLSTSIQQGINVHYVELMLMAMECETGVMNVCASMPIHAGSKNGKKEHIEVDIVSCQGLRWLKLRTASSKQLQDEVNKPGWELPLLRLLQGARANRLPFMQIPEVVVLFRELPPPAMSEAIQRMGAKLLSCATLHAQTGVSITPQHWQNPEFLPPKSIAPNFVCFDTTALVGLCSETCFTKSPEENVETLREFPVMAEQQRREIMDPCVTHYIEPTLDCNTVWYDEDGFMDCMCDSIKQRIAEFECTPIVTNIDVFWLERLVSETSLQIEGALPVEESALVCRVYAERKERIARGEMKNHLNWIITDITLAEFRWILETIAGPRELRRALTLLQCCRVVSMDRRSLDAATPLLTHVSLLAFRKKVSERNRFVFALADVLKALVLSSNRQVLHAAELEGLRLGVVLHPARALTEQKLYGLSRRDGPWVPPRINGDSSGADYDANSELC